MNHGRPQSQPPEWKPDISRLKKIIEQTDGEELNKYANELGEMFTKKLGKEKELSTSQIRSVLDELQRMPRFDRNALQLLRPQLAYVAGRHGGRVKQLQQVMEEAIKLTLAGTDEKRFDNLKNFFEAIVAYHRFHGGE